MWVNAYKINAISYPSDRGFLFIYAVQRIPAPVFCLFLQLRFPIYAVITIRADTTAFAMQILSYVLVGIRNEYKKERLAPFLSPIPFLAWKIYIHKNPVDISRIAWTALSNDDNRPFS